MISNLEEDGINNFQAKEEGSGRKKNEARSPMKAPLFSNPSTSTSSSSRQWSAFRNPRIVRVSRTFGGKDRHSKVCTIRGLRDRRIRLSVPTAIQLYDLQDKLGLGQPSKVIDWLLDASKEDIEKLPPLQFPQGFGHHHFNPQQMYFHEPGLGLLKDGMPGHSSFLSGRHGININEACAGFDHHEEESSSPQNRASGDLLTYHTQLHLGGLRMTRESSEIIGRDSDKGKWVQTNEVQNLGGAADCSNSSQQAQVSAQNFFPIVGYSLGGLPQVNPMLPYGYNSQWEPSGLSLSQFGSHGLRFQSESMLGSNAVTVAASNIASLSGSALSSSPQMYFCPSTTTPPLFSPYPQFLSSEGDPRQMGHHLQLPSSLMPSGLHMISSTMKPFQGNTNKKNFHPEDNDGGEEDDEGSD